MPHSTICAHNAVQAIELLEPMTTDPVDYVRQGALIALAMVLVQVKRQAVAAHLTASPTDAPTTRQRRANDACDRQTATWRGMGTASAMARG